MNKNSLSDFREPKQGFLLPSKEKMKLHVGNTLEYLMNFNEELLKKKCHFKTAKIIFSTGIFFSLLLIHILLLACQHPFPFCTDNY